MEKKIRKYYLVSFYIITFVFSFLLLTLHVVFQSAGKYGVSFTQLAPGFAVVFIALIMKDKTIINDIKVHFNVDKVFLKWLIPTIAIPGIVIVVSSFIMTYYKIDYFPWKGNLSFYILNFIAFLVGCAAEEIGWRGFLLPNLQKKYTPFISSLIVGILWGIWHLNFTGGILGFALYTITIIEMSILMTWVYNKSNGNMLLMTIWHLTFNVTSHIFLWNRFSLELFIVEGIVFGVLCLFILIIEKKFYFLKNDLVEESIL
ncbi:MAG TPA: type II CAAX endopeptidase family protein [Lachnospiraceae bacterium]|nr:type II CAAX endopeptidase family protein [Lachnospiraceae bacterium]